MHPVLAAQEARAREVIDPAVLSWIDDGAVDGTWSSYAFRPHVLRDVSSVSTETALLGTTMTAPVLVAPTAFHGRVHPSGEAATAAGAAAVGALMVWSMRASVPFEGRAGGRPTCCRTRA